MAVRFTIRVAHEEGGYALQAAAAAFRELGELERRLSRFVQGSDVWRINRLRRGEAAVVTLDTLRCLMEAEEIRRQTGGAFDATYASTPGSLPAERLELTLCGCTVRVLAEGVRVDLGGIGKGYALDRMAAVLREWDVAVGLLGAGTSTILALNALPDEAGWPVTFGPDHDLRRAALADAAFSGSGIAVRGSHIVDPRTGEPAGGRVQAWSRARTAAAADALSTAFMVMRREEIARLCRGRGDVRAYLLDAPEGALCSLPEAPRRRDTEETTRGTT